MAKIDLKNVSDAELKQELERRNGVDSTPPKRLTTPDFSRLIECVVAGVERAAKEQYADEDFDHYVYEAAVEAIYGKDFWSWWNRQSWNG